MNYYIQGCAAKADKIKAAFKRLGIKAGGYDFSRKDVLFFTFEAKGKTYMMSSLLGTGLDNIILTHPNYKELELPVEPKFKKGDWIACDADSFTLSIKSVKDGNYFFHQGASLPIKDIDEHYHLWTIQDAKDGDVLFSLDSKQPFIYKERPQFSQAIGYCCINKFGEFGVWNTSKCVICTDKYVPATKEQRDLLFAKMKEAGYEWDADKKELRKIQPHYNIANFYAGMPVLVRADNDCSWDYSVFSRNTGNEYWPFAVCNGVSFTQCIPFNEDTKHLLGTTDMCDEQYINW